MIRVKQLFEKVGWDAVNGRFLEIYSDQDTNLDAHRRAFEEMLSIEIIEGPPGDRVSYVEWKPDEHFPGDQGGYDVALVKEGDPQRWAIEWIPWKESLGFFVDEESLAKYSEVDHACHILWELTFMGFSEKDVAEEREELSKRIDEASKDIEAGNYKEYTNAEDFLKDLSGESDK
jgi:hypothetical protein